MTLNDKAITKIEREYHKQWVVNEYNYGVGMLQVCNECFGDKPAVVMSNGQIICNLEEISKFRKELEMLYTAVCNVTGIEF